MNLRDIIFLLFIVDEINAARGRLKKASRVINRNINKAEEMMVNAVNGTDFTLDCSSARNFVRTHMAPDFENPQLVRRLDWFHDGTLVASYQQVYFYQKNLKENKSSKKFKVTILFTKL